jgi:hypothetical protein
MAAQPLPAELERALVAGLDAAFLGVGADPDVDTAFDDATETAWYDYGHARLIPSVASIDAGHVIVADARPASRALAVQAALTALTAGELEAGTAYAYALTDDTAYRRRRVRLTLTDPALEVGPEGMYGQVSTELAQRLLAEADAAGAPLADGERLESIEVQRVRARYRPVATVHRGASASSFAVLLAGADRLLSTGHANGGEARRAAVALANAGPVAGEELARQEIVKITRRVDGPLIDVARTRVAQRVTLRLTFAVEKDPGRTKHTGWLFAGRAGA